MTAGRAAVVVDNPVLTNLTSSGPSAGASAGGLSSIEPYILTGLLGANACYAVCLLPVFASRACCEQEQTVQTVQFLVWIADTCVRLSDP